MAKVITFSLDKSSIENAIEEVNQYRDEFQRKCRELREKIAERIRWSAEKGFRTAMVSDTFLRITGKKKERVKEPLSPVMNAAVEVQISHDDSMSVIFTDDKEAMFIEFGAGVYYNGAPGDSPHPWGVEKGYVIGAYGHGNGVKNVWGYYDGNSVVLTHGTPAVMPMYRGAEEAIRAMSEIVREVFG